MTLRKKYTALLMAFFLMFSHIGLALNVHFCGDVKIASTTVYSKLITELCRHESQPHQHSQEESCFVEKSCCTASDDHSGCCKNELIKQDNSEVVVVKSFNFSVDAFILNDSRLWVEFYEVNQDIKPTSFSYSYSANAPPLYRLYCSLIYYA